MNAVFELVPVPRPILSVSRLVDTRFAVLMGSGVGQQDVQKWKKDTSPEVHRVEWAMAEVSDDEDDAPMPDAPAPRTCAD